MRAWVAERFGKPSEVLTIKDMPEPEVEPGHVLVRVETATVNKNEVDGIYGLYASMPHEAPFIPGFEVLGRVIDTGAGAEAFAGTRVIGMPRTGCGGYAEYAVLPTTMAFVVPDEMDTATASGIFWPFHLAWLDLHARARLQEGESVLIHAGAGGLGSAAIQLASLAGARVLATAGSPEKLDLCRDLGAELAIDYRNDDFVARALDATDGRGVDVALDSIGGDVLEQTWRCLNYGARHIILGFSSGIEQEDNRPVLLRQVIFGNFSMVGVLMTYLDDTRQQDTGMGYPAVNFNMPTRAMGEEIHQKLLGLFSEKKVRSVIGREVAFEELPSGMDDFEDRKVAGRLVMHV
jgi:NADPH2:quinone reductase